LRTDDAETGAGRGGIGILEGIPVGIEDTKDGTPDLIPIEFGVGNARNTEIRCVTGNRPSSLGDPDRFSLRNTLGGIIRGKKQVVAGGDGVGFRVLEIGVLVEAEEINGVRDGEIGAIHPRCPGIYVANRDIGKGGARDKGLDLANIADELRGLCTCTREILDPDRRVAIQVFAPDGDTNHDIGEIVAVGGNGRAEGSQFIVECFLAGRAPETKEERGLGVDGGRDGLDGRVGRVALDHGVETRTRPARRADEVFCRVEERLKVGLWDGRAIGEGRSVVEPLVDGCRGTRNARGEKSEVERVHLKDQRKDAKKKLDD